MQRLVQKIQAMEKSSVIVCPRIQVTLDKEKEESTNYVAMTSSDKLFQVNHIMDSLNFFSLVASLLFGVRIVLIVESVFVHYSHFSLFPVACSRFHFFFNLCFFFLFVLLSVHLIFLFT